AAYRLGRGSLFEQLEQRTAAQTVGGFRHFEECRLTLEDVLFEPVQRGATQLQRFEVALIFGAQRRACRALARPCGGGVGQRLVFERALAVENRDLAREPDEVRGAEGPAGPGAAERE